MAIAIFGGGCFWCLDAVFRKVKGITKVISGYTGGRTENPDYRSVCTGDTGHVEVVEIEFDPEKISYEDLLEIFFSIHDPTTLDQQGHDIGSQYRSVIYFLDNSQREIALKKILSLEKENRFRNKIVTEVAPAEKFYPAEGYHQDYFNLNPMQPYCMYLISPKIKKFTSAFPEKLSANPL